MSENKTCIACAEEIKASALLCKHCKTRQDDETFEMAASKPRKKGAPASAEEEAPSKSGFIFAAVLVVAVAAVGVYFSNGQSLSFSSPQVNQTNSGFTGISGSDESSGSTGISGSDESSGSTETSGSTDTSGSDEGSDANSSFSEDIFSDCLAYQNASYTELHPISFLAQELAYTDRGASATYVSQEFREVWIMQRSEIDEKGFSSTRRYDFAVSRLTTLCSERAGFILSFVY
jgi:hypothetical protein